MKKTTFLVIIFAVIIVAAIAYIAGSVNKRNDRVAAENTNIVNTSVTYSQVALEGTDIQLDVPDTFALCPDTSEFFPGLAGYILRDRQCDNQADDAADMQIFVVKSASPEDVIRDKGSVFFTNDPDMIVTEKTTNSKKYFVAESSNGEYLVAIQVNDEVIYIQAIWLELYKDSDVIDHMITSVSAIKNL